MIKSNKITKLNANPVGAGLVPAQNSEGITLVALIITIIIMLILLGVTVNIALNGGLFGMTKEAVKQTEIAAYKEKIDAVRINIIVEQISKGLTSEKFMKRYEEELRKDKNFEGSDITREGETIILITKEGYKFIITEEGTNYEGDTNAPETPETPKTPPNLTENDITYDKETWTQGPVMVSIREQIKEDILIKGYTLKYQKNGGTVQDYLGPIEMTENGTIDIQLIDSETKTVVKTVTANITNIDPKAPTVTASATSTAKGNKITLTFSDNAKDGNEIKWGVCTTGHYTDANIKFTATANSATFDTSDCSISDYYIYAKDSAGNITADEDAWQITITEANLQNERRDREGENIKNYTTLKEAFDDTKDGDIIKALRTFSDDSDARVRTTIGLDLKDKIITKKNFPITTTGNRALYVASGTSGGFRTNGALVLPSEDPNKPVERSGLFLVKDTSWLNLGFDTTVSNVIKEDRGFAGTITSNYSGEMDKGRCTCVC